MAISVKHGESESRRLKNKEVVSSNPTLTTPTGRGGRRWHRANMKCRLDSKNGQAVEI